MSAPLPFNSYTRRQVLYFGAATALFAPLSAQARVVHAPAGRTPWLLFPLDLSKFRGVTSVFGPRVLGGSRETHKGADFSAPNYTAVLAAREGKVVRIGYGRRSGWYVKLDHRRWKSVYCHLIADPRKSGLKEGQNVGALQQIARVGSTGRSTGPHLHFGLRNPDDHFVDPLKHLYTPAETLRLTRSYR